MSNRSVPLVGNPPRLGKLEIQTHTFANGLMLACVEQRNLPIVDVEIVVRAGAAWDAPARAGRAFMAAEMLDEGTGTRDVLQIADAMDFLGAHLGLHAGWDSTVAGLHVLSHRLAEALDVVFDVLLDPSFPPAEYERKRRERVSALQQEHEDARVIANKALTLGIFGPHHPYGMPIGGTSHTLTATSLPEVQQFYHTHFVPANTFVVIVGDVAFDRIVADIEKRVTGWTGAATGTPVLPAASRAAASHILLVDKPRAAQAEIRVGHIGPARGTPDYFPLVVMNTMLGGAFTSRLNLRLREEMGVTYGASSKFGWRKQSGMFWASSAVDSNAAADSIAVMLEEMRRLRDEPVAIAEMERAARYIAYGMPRSFESTEDVAAHVREQILHGLPLDYWSTYVENILAVTPQDVQDAGERHLDPEHAVGVVVADRATVEGKLRDLQLGDILITELAP